jgi:hypothetical protein
MNPVCSWIGEMTPDAQTLRRAPLQPAPPLNAAPPRRRGKLG